jgi:alpha-ketoglutarate-dependent taurine dioxygenase
MKLRYHKNNWTVLVEDLDLARVTEQEVNTLGYYVAHNTCVVIPNQQHLSVQDELRVMSMFGNVEDNSALIQYEQYRSCMVSGGNNKIARVTGELDEHGLPGLFGHVSELDWHCNQPAVPARKPIVWLLAIKGTRGSRTSWINNILSYRDLPDEIKVRIHDLEMVCGWKKDNYSEFDFRIDQKQIPEDFNEHYTPKLVYTNNVGKTGLFFPFLQFRNFVGMTETQSRDLVITLKEHVLQDKYMYHHDWKDGDVVLSEQWLGIHKRWKFDGMNTRILHRITADFANIDFDDMALMAELVDALDLGSSAARCESSSLS